MQNGKLKSTLEGWKPTGSGFLINPVGGLFFCHATPGGIAGAHQVIELNHTEVKGIKLIGFAMGSHIKPDIKTDDYRAAKSGDYSVKMDVILQNGDRYNDIIANFNPTADDIHGTCVEYIPLDPIKTMHVYISFSHHEGSVTVAEIQMEEFEHVADVEHHAVKVLIPMKSYPNSEWDDVINSASDDFDTTIVVDIKNGPGKAKSRPYEKKINLAKSNGIKVLGYVDGSGDVMSSVNKWKSLYNIDGIYLVDFEYDEDTVVDIKNKKLSVFIETTEELDTVDTIVSFRGNEKDWMNTKTSDYVQDSEDPYHHAVIVESSESVEEVLQKAVDDNYGYIYVSKDEDIDLEVFKELVVAYNKSLN